MFKSVALPRLGDLNIQNSITHSIDCKVTLQDVTYRHTHTAFCSLGQGSKKQYLERGWLEKRKKPIQIKSESLLPGNRSNK